MGGAVLAIREGHGDEAEAYDAQGDTSGCHGHSRKKNNAEYTKDRPCCYPAHMDLGLVDGCRRRGNIATIHKCYRG